MGKTNRTNRRYSDDEIAAALAIYKANGGNLAATSRDTGIDRSTIKRWANGEGWARVAENLESKQAAAETELKGLLMEAAIAFARRSLALVDEADVREASTAAGIYTDKIIRLSVPSAQPTITQVHVIDD